MILGPVVQPWYLTWGLVLLAPVAEAVKHHQGLVAASLFTLWPDIDGQPMISPHLLERRPFLRAGDFAPGSWGQANVAAIAPWVDVSVCKVAYSAFFNTQLDWVLRRAGVPADDL